MKLEPIYFAKIECFPKITKTSLNIDPKRCINLLSHCWLYESLQLSLVTTWLVK